MRAVCLIVARYTRDYQGPSREFLWMLEVELRTLIIEMIALSAEEEIDRQLEQPTWDRTSSQVRHSYPINAPSQPPVPSADSFCCPTFIGAESNITSLLPFETLKPNRLTGTYSAKDQTSRPSHAAARATKSTGDDVCHPTHNPLIGLYYQALTSQVPR
ncbi:hypothetical protein VN97_g2567 [Penicillium thymicola]|uniref:Uncharacterized protein n=1 Tax=Penicillium thymicola TaxID=293382 RepID=A0AAI9TNT2_PENTH|nr:hypothetical protein VN97_g2567 [Penicillium thymicola]